jgi:hypothetical protein
MVSVVFHAYAVQNGAMMPNWSFALFDSPGCPLENMKIWGLMTVLRPGLVIDIIAGLEASSAP